MIDYGARKTDLAVKRAEWRLSRVYRQAEREIQEKMETWQKRHAAREKLYRQQLKDGKITQADFDAWMRGQVFQGKQWQARKEQIQAVLLNADKTAAKIVNDGKLGVFVDNANYIGYGLEHDANINTGFMLYDEQTVARLIKSDPQILPKPAPGVKKDKAYTYYNKLVNGAITQGIIQGEDIRQIAKRIARETGERSYSSAVRNARTAFTGAQNAGRIEGLHQAQRLGIEVKKKWLATLDSRTRDSHRHLDGQIQEVDDPFISELGKIRFPGDPTANGGDVYNCRCTLTYVYPEYPSEMQRRDNETGEIVGDMTYEEWERMKRGEGEAPEPEKAPPQFKIRHADFTPAVSVKEAEEYASQFMGYNGKVSYRGLSVDAANACNQIIADMRANIPGFKLSGIEPMNMRSNMWKGKTAEAAYRWGGDGTLYINPTYYKNAKAYGDHVAEIDKLMQTVLSSGQELIDSGRVSGTRADYISALLETKRQAVSQSHDFMQGTFVHEMGHALDDKYVRRELRELYPGIDGVRDFLSQSRTTYGSHISGYAIADGNEYIAESFTAWWYGERDKVDPILSGVFEKVMSQ
jgi:SPP1 gp7 family putative phage head morphogenesis protein